MYIGGCWLAVLVLPAVIAETTWQLEIYGDEECLTKPLNIILGNDTTLCEDTIGGFRATILRAPSQYRLWTWGDKNCVKRAFNIEKNVDNNHECVLHERDWFASWQVVKHEWSR